MTAPGFLFLEDLAPRFGRPWSRATRMWLLRTFRAREQLMGLPPGALLLRNGQGLRSRWYTTEPLLRRGFRELVPWDAEIVKAARSEVEELRERLCLVEMKVEAMARGDLQLAGNVGDKTP